MSIWEGLDKKIGVFRCHGGNELHSQLLTIMSINALSTGHVMYYRSGGGYLKPGKKIEDFMKIFETHPLKKIVSENRSEVYIFKSDDDPVILYGVGGRCTEVGKYDFSLCAWSEDLAHAFDKKCGEFFEEKTENNVYMLTNQPGQGYGFSKIGSLDSPLMRENYEDKIVSAFDYMVENLTGKSPPGKLAILSGPPGTGKSYFIKGLIDKVSKNSMCVILPAQLITELDGPGLVPVLISQKAQTRWDELTEQEVPAFGDKPIVFIAEDCDHYLVPREGANSSLISGLLNYTDGIMSDLLNIRFIATTNAPHLAIDQALKRPGRLLKHCFIDSLSVDKANEIYERLTEKKGTDWFDEPASLAEVYARANGIETYNEEECGEKEKRLGFNP
jgi:hypothetical protein